MSDILFDDIPVEQQETVVGGDNYYSFSSTKAEGVNETLETICWRFSSSMDALKS